MLTIVIFYHYSGSKCFRYYYQDWVLAQLRSYFSTLICGPNALAVTRVVPVTQMALCSKPTNRILFLSH